MNRIVGRIVDVNSAEMHMYLCCWVWAAEIDEGTNVAEVEDASTVWDAFKYMDSSLPAEGVAWERGEKAGAGH